MASTKQNVFRPVYLRLFWLQIQSCINFFGFSVLMCCCLSVCLYQVRLNTAIYENVCYAVSTTEIFPYTCFLRVTAKDASMQKEMLQINSKNFLRQSVYRFFKPLYLLNLWFLFTTTKKANNNNNKWKSLFGQRFKNMHPLYSSYQCKKILNNKFVFFLPATLSLSHLQVSFSPFFFFGKPIFLSTKLFVLQMGQ